MRLTSEILHLFIDKIVVGEKSERYSRTAFQQVTIYYRDVVVSRFMRKLVCSQNENEVSQLRNLTLDYFLVKLYNFLGHSLLSPFRMLCRNSILSKTANYVSFYPFSICATYSTLSVMLDCWI